MLPPLPFLPVSTVAFVLFGALLVLVGSSQAEMQAALALDLTQSGLLASSVIVGIGAGVLVGGPLVDRFARRPLLVLSAGITGAALALVGDGTTFWTLAALLMLAGVGGGLYETVLNACAIERYAEKSVRTLALMHSGATLGGMLTPFAVTWLLGSNDWTLAFRIVGAAHLVLAVAALGLPLGSPVARSHSEATGPLLTAPLVFLFLAAFAYVGVEASITAFAVPYADAGLGLEASRGRSAISAFWLGLLIGRLAFALRAGNDDARPAAFAGGIAGVAIAVGVAAGFTQIELLLGFVGFAMGGVFPLLVALGGRRSPTTGVGVAVVAGLGSAGGFVAPWLTGMVGDTAGIATAFGVLAGWCGVVAICAMLSDRSRRV